LAPNVKGFRLDLGGVDLGATSSWLSAGAKDWFGAVEIKTVDCLPFLHK
jgi:hypothetical protein